MTLTQPLISVVVTTYSLQRLKDVKELVDSLSVQTYPNIELVFVGENRRDLCDEIGSYAHARKIRNVTVLFNDGQPGASAARNLAITRAQGDVIAFLDDCVVAAPNWAEEVVKTYAERDDILGVAGAAEPHWEEPSMGWLPQDLHWLVSCTSFLEFHGKHESAHGATVNVSYRKEAFAVAGVFSPSLGPKRSLYGRRPRWQEGSEDQEFSRRVGRASGKAILFNPAVKVRRKVYKHQLALRFVAQRAQATGWSRHMLQRFYGLEDRTLGQAQFSLLRRIIIKLLPNILARFFTHPVIAWHQLRVTLVALLFVALGYLSFSFHSRFPTDEQLTSSPR